MNTVAPLLVPKYAPEQNPFSTVMVDITHRCNMACHNCYLPNRTIPDLGMDWVLERIARFPKRTNIRLAGAEPNLYPRLPDLITGIRALGHRPIVLTNGLRLADKRYLATLKAAGLRRVYISMNGAGSDDWYEAIDGLRCAAKKHRALENCVDQDMILSTGTILVPGVNDGVLTEMVALVSALGPRSALFRFKSIGHVGRFMDGAIPRLDLAGMIALTARDLGIDPARIDAATRVDGIHESASRFFPLVTGQRSGRGIWIKLSDWREDSRGIVDAGSSRRGRLTPDGTIAPFFEHVKANEGGY